MDEANLAAWQHALLDALLRCDTAPAVREHLRAEMPEQRDRIDALDDRALAVAIDLVRRWSPALRGHERG